MENDALLIKLLSFNLYINSHLMKKITLFLWSLIITLLLPSNISAAPAKILKVNLTGNIAVSLKLTPDMRVLQDNDGSLIIYMDNMGISLPASEINNFSFSDDPIFSVGIDYLPNYSISEDLTLSGKISVEMSYSGRILRLWTNNYSSFNADVYSLSGRKVDSFSGNPIEIDTSSFIPDTYILSTGNKSFKFTVR